MQTALVFFAVLIAGTAFGWLARVIIPGKQPLTWAETTIVGIVGSGIGAIAGNWLGVGEDLFSFSMWTIAGSIVGSVVVLALVVFIMDRRGIRKPSRRTAAEIAAAGESDTVEFKQTARWNIHTQQRDEKIEMVIAKTIAGFMNADGGTLLIGIDDAGHPTGLDNDLSLGKVSDHDRYQLWLTDHIQRTLGKTAAARIDVTFEPVEGIDVCRVDVEASDRPVFLDEPKGPRTAYFYVRIGNSTRRLLPDELLRYRDDHWG